MRTRVNSAVFLLTILAMVPASAGAKSVKSRTGMESAPSASPRILAPPSNDRCDGAIVLPRCENISKSGNTDEATNDYDFVDSLHSCTDQHSAGGRDVVYKMTVFTGDSLWVNYQSRADGSIYLVTDCNNEDGTCVAGADMTYANEIESLRYKFTTPGTYYLILDSYGLNSSGLWTLAGQLVCGPSTPPANDLCENATTLPCGSFNLSGNTQFAHDDYHPSTSCTGQLAAGADVVYKITVAAGDSIWMDYTMSGANGSVYIVADCNDVNGTCITGKDAAGTGQPENLRYKFNFSGTYYVILDSRSAGTGTWSAAGALICLNPPPPNDRCADAILAACGDFSWSGTTTYATNDYSFGTGQSCTGSSADGKDVVYRFNVNAGDSVSVSYRALTTDASMYLVTDCADVVGSCRVGKDETFVGEWETLHYTFPTSGTYYLILDSFDPNSSSSWSANGHLYCNVLGVDPVAPGAGLALRQIQPNPFHERTSILFQLPARARTTLRLYDLQGRVVRTLVDADAEPGLHNAVWDGSDDHGTKVGTGVYFARLSSGDQAAIRRMIFVK